MDTPESTRNRRLITGAGLLAAGALAGAVAVTAIGASADTGRTDGTDGTPPITSDSGLLPGQDMHGPDQVRDDETEVSGDLAAELEAAAQQAVPGGRVYRVETDAGDAAYEVHMTGPDGDVTVKFDDSLNVVEVQGGTGKGDPGGPRRPHGGPGMAPEDTTTEGASA